MNLLSVQVICERSVYVYVRVLAMLNKALAETISNREFELWTRDARLGMDERSLSDVCKCVRISCLFSVNNIIYWRVRR